ncbi:hypothetical protein GCM10027035_49010 [Emticicia sediminis]
MKEQFEANTWELVPPEKVSAKMLKDYKIKFENWLNLRTAFFENLNLVFPQDLVKELDFSINSLLSLGDYIYINHKREEIISNQNMLFFDFCARYFGEVIIKNYPNQEWKISYGKKEYGFLRPYINVAQMEPIGQIHRIFSNNNFKILYEEAVHFETILKVQEEFREKSKYFGLSFDQYEYMLLINENSDFNLELFIEMVCKALKSATVENIDESYYFTINKWVLWLSYNGGETIREEAEEISLKMKDLEKREKVKNCKIRIDMVATKDRQMNHFNDHIFVLEAFETFKEVFIYNSRSAEFFNSNSIGAPVLFS